MSFQAIDRFLVGTVFASGTRKKMPDKCIVFGCNNSPNKEKDSPSSSFFLRTDDKEKWKRRKKIDAKLKHAHWKPTKYSAVCSKITLLSGLTTVGFFTFLTLIFICNFIFYLNLKMTLERSQLCLLSSLIFNTKNISYGCE